LVVPGLELGLAAGGTTDRPDGQGQRENCGFFQ